MKLKTLQIMDFEGFEGKFSYEFTKTLNAICLKNGAGKTSFLNALRYGITGVKPAGNMINNNASTAAVGLTFHDGTGIIRQDYAERTSRYFLNRRPVTKKDLDEYLQSKAGVVQNTMKIATSTDVLAGLKPQEFGDLLLSYIPESLTTDILVTMLGNLTEEEKAEIKKFFPDGTFGTEKIDEFHKHLSGLRKELNKKLSECETYLNYYSKIPATTKSKEELEKELKELNEKQGGVNLYNEQKKNYDLLLRNKKELDEKIARIEKEIKETENIKVDEEIYKKTLAYKDTVTEQIKTIEKNIDSIENLVKTLKKALEDINKPICPLSEKLKCTTDKSVIRGEIEGSLNSGQKSIDDNRKTLDKLKNNLKETDKYIEETDRNRNVLKNVAEKKEELKNLKAQTITIPKEPVKPAQEDLTKEIKAVVDAISRLEKDEDIKKVKDFWEKHLLVLEAYNNLIKMFAPKGVVKEKIAEYYMTAFEEQCNLKAKELLPDMNIKFVSGAGISVVTDMNGDGNYVPFESLSGGEKSYVLFILLDMINCLTGLRMLFLDELSVLDKEAFNTLVRIIKEHEEDYDLIILATAEHDDNIETLNKYGVNLINF